MSRREVSEARSVGYAPDAPGRGLSFYPDNTDDLIWLPATPTTSSKNRYLVWVAVWAVPAYHIGWIRGFWEMILLGWNEVDPGTGTVARYWVPQTDPAFRFQGGPASGGGDIMWMLRTYPCSVEELLLDTNTAGGRNPRLSVPPGFRPPGLSTNTGILYQPPFDSNAFPYQPPGQGNPLGQPVGQFGSMHLARIGPSFNNQALAPLKIPVIGPSLVVLQASIWQPTTRNRIVPAPSPAAAAALLPVEQQLANQAGSLMRYLAIGGGIFGDITPRDRGGVPEGTRTYGCAA